MRKIILTLFGVLFLLFQGLSQKTISGVVTDSKDATPVANVSVSAGKVGTKTDDKGQYNITVPNTAKQLTFTSVGYLEQNIIIAALSTINVSLKQDDGNLKEVVVTAFGIKKDKKTLGYDVTQLSNQELTQAHTTNITNALAGKVPGVRVSGAGGSFTGSSIIIRGYNTFTGSNQPLFVIDGVPIDNGGGGQALQNGAPVSNRGIDINQEDVESMTVLKGPAAAALYGSRASNGAIIITTKKGRVKGRNNIQFSSIYGIESVNRLPDYQNEYAQGLTQLIAGVPTGVYNNTSSSSWGPRIKGQTVTNFFGKPEQLTAYPNNVKDIFRNGENFQNNISFSGGSDKNTFRFSYGNLVNTGILDNNKLVRNNFSINVSSKITEKLTTSVSANYVNNYSKRTQQGNQLSNPLFRAYFMPRSYDLTNAQFEDGAGNQTFFGGEDNPYWTIKHNRFKDEINRLIGNVSLSYKFTNWLQADYKIGTDVYSTFRHGYDQIGARGGANTNANTLGGVFETRNQYRSLNSNFFLSFNKKFGNFTTNAIVGNEIQQVYSATANVTGQGVIVRDFEQLKNTTTFFPSNGSSKTRLVGVYGDFTVAYKSLASINATLRNDFASTFLPGNQSYLYPAVAATFNVTEAVPSLKGKVVDNIKLRANIARVGKAGDFVYATDSYFVGAGPADGFGPNIAFPFNGLQGFTLSNGAGNADLGPEFTTSKEVGAELSFWNGRINIEANVYKTNSEKLIFAVPVSNSAGITTKIQNIGKSSTKGVELALNLTPFKFKGGNWTINFNYTQFKTKVDELAPGVLNIFLGGFTTPNIRLVAGDEYGQIYGNAYQRDAATGQVLINPTTGFPLITSGVQKIGNPNPKYLIGVTNTFTYKGVTLSFLLDIKKGGDQYSRNIADVRRNGVAKETAEFDRFLADGVTVSTPYIFAGVNSTDLKPNTKGISAQNYWGNNGIYAAAEGFIVETSWFRVREASVSYKLPESLLNKLSIGNAELGVFGRNLFLKAKNYPHFDPEQNALGVSNAQGLEFNALPQARSVGVSLKISL
jgi:TonB-linked SusC/RagA family outer membrane protein